LLISSIIRLDTLVNTVLLVTFSILVVSILVVPVLVVLGSPYIDIDPIILLSCNRQRIDAF